MELVSIEARKVLPGMIVNGKYPVLWNRVNGQKFERFTDDNDDMWLGQVMLTLQVDGVPTDVCTGHGVGVKVLSKDSKPYIQKKRVADACRYDTFMVSKMWTSDGTIDDIKVTVISIETRQSKIVSTLKYRHGTVNYAMRKTDDGWDYASGHIEGNVMLNACVTSVKRTRSPVFVMLFPDEEYPFISAQYANR